MGTLKYRKDIDGLRAIAVLAVVFYHFDLGPIHGGFVGVDIFFVISGYLITGIIQKEVERGDFTYANFYERRIRRIFPALFVMLVVTLAIGAWLLLPSDLERLGNSTIATLLFGSNILFWRQRGYFDTSSDFNPLLHTWSLAVEEQFYIGLPILLLLIHRYARRRLRVTLLAVALLSFAACVGMQQLRPAATFFLAPFRAWELMLGALLAVGAAPAITRRGVLEGLSLLALLVLLGSVLWTPAGQEFPGWHAAVPALATAALLHTGGQGESLVRRCLQWQPLVYVGLISYSLYLWHWPILVFFRYQRAMEPLSLAQGLLLAGVAMLLAAASYRWVESPFRQHTGTTGRTTRAPLFWGAAAANGAVAAMAIVATLGQGWQQRFSPAVVAFDRARHPFIPYRACNERPPDELNPDCVIGDRTSDRMVLVWGDSHALAWAPGLDRVLHQAGVKGVLAVNSECAPLLGIGNRMDRACQFDNEQVRQWLQAHPRVTVILLASWISYAAPDGRYSLVDAQGKDGNAEVFPPALRYTLQALQETSSKAMLVGPTPGAPRDIPFRLAAAIEWDRAKPAGNARSRFDEDAAWFWRAAQPYRTDPRVLLVDPAPWFCGATTCRYQSDDGQLLYRDDGHLSMAGAAFVARRLPSLADVAQLPSSTSGVQVAAARGDAAFTR